MADDESSPRLPGERAVPPQGTALVGTEGPQETFGATPEEIKTIRTLLSYIGGEGNEGLFLQVDPGTGKHSVVPYEAFKDLSSEEGQYRVGEEDVQGVREAGKISAAAMVGSMPFPRPAGSLGIFLGMREAEQRLYHGRPAAFDALQDAEIMEAAGKSNEEIQARAREIFRQAGEEDLGQVWKPDYQGSEWRFELLPKTNKPGKKFAKYDPKTPTRPLGEYYKNPDLYQAMPGIEETEVTHLERPLEGGAHGYYDPGMPAAGVKPEIAIQRADKRTGFSSQEERDTLIAELQHAIQDVKGWPRGGSTAEFEPGGRLAHYLRPGETPKRAYARLAGEIESKVAKERATYSTKEARDESVEETIDNLWLKTRDPILEFYRGQRIRANSEPGTRRLAENMAKGARQTVADMKAAGASPEEIAAKLQKDYGSPVTAEQVRGDQGWWNVPQSGAGGYSRWTPEQRSLFLKLHQQGASYSEIVKQLRRLGRETNERAIKDKARAEGLEARQRGGAARNRPPAVPARRKDEET